MRVDQLLVQRQLALTRSAAQRLISAGVEWQDGSRWRRVAKNGDEVPADAPLRLLDDAEVRYVSRGGLKLEAALAHTGLSAQGKDCLDVGQSTGGFTDVLLKAGAARVVGLDVGAAQLHPSLRADPRVVCLEHINARDAQAVKDAVNNAVPQATASAAFDLMVADVSFISLTLILPGVLPLLRPSADVLLLVKPQFELQPSQVGKGGVVRDPALYALVKDRISQACTQRGLHLHDWFDSPITGGDGNHEFFVHARMPAA